MRGSRPGRIQIVRMSSSACPISVGEGGASRTMRQPDGSGPLVTQAHCVSDSTMTSRSSEENAGSIRSVEPTKPSSGAGPYAHPTRASARSAALTTRPRRARAPCRRAGGTAAALDTASGGIPPTSQKPTDFRGRLWTHLATEARNRRRFPPLGSTVERRGGSSPPPCTHWKALMKTAPLATLAGGAVEPSDDSSDD